MCSMEPLEDISRRHRTPCFSVQVLCASVFIDDWAAIPSDPGGRLLRAPTRGGSYAVTCAIPKANNNAHKSAHKSSSVIVSACVGSQTVVGLLA